MRQDNFICGKVAYNSVYNSVLWMVKAYRVEWVPACLAWRSRLPPKHLNQSLNRKRQQTARVVHQSTDLTTKFVELSAPNTEATSSTEVDTTPKPPPHQQSSKATSNHHNIATHQQHALDDQACLVLRLEHGGHFFNRSW